MSALLAVLLALSPRPARAASPGPSPATTAAAAPAAPAPQENATVLAARLKDKSLPPAERDRLLKQLARVRDARQLPELFAIAASTAVEAPTAEAAWAALIESALDAPADARALVPGWLRSPDPESRFRALGLLKEGVWDAALTPLVRKILLKDADDENRAEAAAVLGANEVQIAKPDLLKAARDRSNAVREAAGQALSALDSAETD